MIAASPLAATHRFTHHRKRCVTLRDDTPYRNPLFITILGTTLGLKDVVAYAPRTISYR